jgi:hypothetical protein
VSHFERRCSSVSFRDQPSFPIAANTTVHLKCQDHLVDLVSQSGHLELPPGAVLMVEQCHVLTYVDFAESLASAQKGPKFGPASFLGSAPNAAFHAFNSTVQYAHVVRSSFLIGKPLLQFLSFMPSSMGYPRAPCRVHLPIPADVAGHSGPSAFQLLCDFCMPSVWLIGAGAY